jgi:hypothetical protein
VRRRWRQSWWSPSVSFAGASHAASNGRIRARGTAAPRSPSRNGSAGFFPLPPSGGIPRGTKKPSAAVLRDALGLTAAGRSLPRAKDRHRGCDWRGPTTEEDHHGYHRHLHCGGQRLRRIGQDAHAQLQGKVRPDRKGHTRRPTIGSSQVPSNAAPPGRRPRGTAIANISRSSSTIRVFRRRSMPRW